MLGHPSMTQSNLPFRETVNPLWLPGSRRTQQPGYGIGEPAWPQAGGPSTAKVGSAPPSSSVHEILQVRLLEWVAISSSRGSS